jgi:hypothetical protein
MRPSVRSLRLLAVVGAVCTAGCLHKTPTGPLGVLRMDRLVEELRQQRVTVSRQGAEPRDAFPFFSVQPTRLTINGDDVHIFEFTTETIATSAASTVAAAGTPIGTTQVTWISPPRFYRRNRFIALYLGGAGETVRALDAVFGKPFAGGS